MKHLIVSLWRKQFSLAIAVALALKGFRFLAICTGGLATWAQLSQNPITEPDIKDPILWVMIMVTVVAALDFGSWIRGKAYNKRQSETKSNFLVQGFMEIRECVKLKANGGNPLKARECLLAAAAYDLRMALGIEDHESIKTNLNLASLPDSFEVVARSRPGSAVGRKYKMSPAAAVTQAMNTNRTFQVENAESLTENESRSYNCVVATPIANGNKAYGAISADHTGSKTFKGKESLIEQILRPYAAAILLTIPTTSPSFTCPEWSE